MFYRKQRPKMKIAVNEPIKIVENIKPYDGYCPEPVWIPKEKNTSTYYDYRSDSQVTVPLRSLDKSKDGLVIE